MSSPSARSALLAGATGLVGRALLTLLRRDYGRLDVLARRAAGELASDGRVNLHIVDFARLPESMPTVDDVYIALGTTIKVAGSEAAFRAVDLDAVVATARAARQAGATRLGVVSALGADRGSRIFYNRVKGEMQEAVATLGYESVVIAQPSLLLGDRAALGQPVRRGEVWAARLLGPAMRLVPRAVRPIATADVAAALVGAVRAGRPGVRLLPSAEMQDAAERRR
ncbi:MAG: NAD(P)H-binding protein [Caldimonas sp.]